VLTAERYEPAPALAAGAALVTLAVGLALRRRSPIPAAVVLLGAAYAVSVESRGAEIDGASVIVAAALLVTAELGYWSVESALVPPEPGLTPARLGVLTALVGASLLAGTLLLATTAIAVPSTWVMVGAGVLAATGALALSARLARRG
jgi:hypothetical protein